MKRIILISHKEFAKGIKSTLEFFAGKNPNLYAIDAYENGENNFPKKQLEDLINSFDANDEVFILTDLLGGSVNQNCSQLMSDRVHVITGINLPFGLTLLLDTSEHLTDDEIEKMISKAASQIIYMNNYNKVANTDDE